MNAFDGALHLLARKRLPVLLFHKIPLVADPLTPQDLDLPGFERVLDFVAERFRVIPFTDAVDAVRRGKLPPNAACITFDDGYDTWLQGAVPALEKRGLHATFFITTGQFKGWPMWHERVTHALSCATQPVLDIPGFGLPPLPIMTLQEKQQARVAIENFLKYHPLAVREGLMERLEHVTGAQRRDVTCMPVADLREMHNRGFGIGAHTSLHPILTLCDPQQAMHEIGSVREELGALTGGTVRAFAYPNGRPVSDFNIDHVRMVRRAGYDCAATTQWGGAGRDTPVFQIPRFTPWGPTAPYMALQMGRNLFMKPRILREAAQEDEPAAAAGKGRAPASGRIMFVENGSGFGGAVVALQSLVAHVSPAKVRCDVITNLPVGDFLALPSVGAHKVISDRLYNFRPLVQRIDRTALPAPAKRAVLFGIGRLDDLINRFPYLLRLLVHAWRLDPDIIHGNNEPSSNREAMLVARLLRKPYVQHVRGALGQSRHAPWLLQQPHAFIPVSRWLAGDLQNAGVSVERIRQIYDGIELPPSRPSLTMDAAQARLRPQFGIAPDVPVVAMVGMLVGWKGQRIFIEAVRQLVEQGSRAAFLVIGGTPERGEEGYALELREMVARYRLDDAVFFTGRRNDLQAVLPEIDVVVSASLEPEPLGLVMLEAMASGCAFVAPAFGAATEVVDDGVNGFLFTPGSAASLAHAIGRAVEASGNEPALAVRARDAVRHRFDAATCAVETSRLYGSLMDGVRRGTLR
jgi:glycosyltransferase involved in cell wall biosynthesis/peptidoglycan/xylan/chitin deacetylase (PgdA/CDA1 family)